MKALILDRWNKITHMEYLVIDTRSFREFLIETHESFPIGTRVDLNVEALKRIKLLSDIGAYHPH